MNRIIITIVIILMVVSSPCAEEEFPIFQGQIFARVNSGPILGSSIASENLIYLFRIESQPPIVIKLVNNFMGRIQPMSEKLLKRAPILKIETRRHDSCDESYGSFMRNLNNYAEKRTVGKKPFQVLTYYENVLRPQLSENDMLKCYIMKEDRFIVVKKTHK
jgi:hypothetical protein